MPTLEQLIDKFHGYSDEELFNVYDQLDGYTDTGKQAFGIAIEKRGGLDYLKDKTTRLAETKAEISKVKSEVRELLQSGVAKTEIIDRVEIHSVTKDKLLEIINEVSAALANDESDRKIKPRTILGGIIGGIIGGTLGGILWGIQMVYSKQMFFIFGIGLVLLSYGSIKLFTRQSKKNAAVMVITIVSVLYALLLGQVIFEVFG